MADFESIDLSLLQSVSGGEMQFHPALVGTLEKVAQQKRTKPDDSAIKNVATTLTMAVSDLGTRMNQSRQESSQAMMQMLPQMMRR